MVPDLLGRSISIENIDINIYRATVLVENFRIFEKDGKSSFFSFNSFFINVDPLKLLLNNAHVAEIAIDSPSGNIFSSRGKFNFDDIVRRFTPSDEKKSLEKKEESGGEKSKIFFTLGKFKVKNPNVTFKDDGRNLNLDYRIDGFELFDLSASEKVTFVSTFFDRNIFDISLDFQSDDEKLTTGILIKRFELKHFLPIYKMFIDSAGVYGTVDADISISLLKKRGAISISGEVNLNDFQLKNNENRDVAAFDKLSIDVERFLTGSKRVDVRKISLSGLKSGFILEKDGNNFLKLLKKRGGNDSVNEKGKSVAEDKPFHFRLALFEIKKGEFFFIDKSKSENFRADLKGMEAAVENLTSGKEETKFKFKTSLNNEKSKVEISGHFKQLSNPSGRAFIDLKNINLSDFRPIVSRFININGLQGNLSIKNIIDFKMAKKPVLKISTDLSLNRFKIVDSRSFDLVKIGDLVLKMNNLDTSTAQVDIETINIDSPSIYFYKMKNGDAFSLLAKVEKSKSEKVEESMSGKVAEYESRRVEKMKRGGVKDDQIPAISLSGLKITKGNVVFQDFSLKGAPKVRVDDLYTNLIGFSTRKNEKAWVDFSAKIGGTGELRSRGSFRIGDRRRVDISTTLSGLDLYKIKKIVNGYSPVKIEQGTLDFNGNLNLRNNILESENVVKLHKFSVLDKEKSLFGTKMPLSLVLLLMEDYDNNIKIDIPLKGDISDPRFKIEQVVAGVFKDLILNVVTSPLKILKAIAGTEEEISFLEWDYYPEKSDQNKKKLEQLLKILRNKKEIGFTFVEKFSREAIKKEAEFILIKGMFLKEKTEGESPGEGNKEVDVTSKEFNDFWIQDYQKETGKRVSVKKSKSLLGMRVLKWKSSRFLK